MYTKDIKQGSIDSDVSIEAIDGSFKLSGEFEAPFKSRAHLHSLNANGNKLLSMYRHALSFDAKKVKIDYRGKTLYGVLALDGIDGHGYGIGTTSYKIIIPEAYVKASEGGKISVVYEYYHIEDYNMSDNSNIKKYSWVLWFSDKDIF
jgi:hypothetical protein